MAYAGEECLRFIKTTLGASLVKMKFSRSPGLGGISRLLTFMPILGTILKTKPA